MIDHIDDLLQDEGARWRDRQPAPRPVDPAIFTRSRRWQPAAAAAGVVALAAAATVTAIAFRPTPTGTPAAAIPTATTSTGNPELDKWLLHEGDRVKVSFGLVVASAGRPVMACHVQRGTSPTDATPICVEGVPLVGVDLDRLTERLSVHGTVWGLARFEGIYRNGTVTVDQQTGPGGDGPALDDTARCTPPTGGWNHRPAPAAAKAAIAGLDAYANAHPDQYLVPSAGILPQAPGDRAAPPVPVILTTLDPAVARPRLQAEYGGNDVCVYRVPNSRSDLTAAAARARAVDPGRRLGGFTDEINGYYDLQPMVVDPVTLATLARIDDGEDVIRVTPLVEPVG